MVFRYSFLLCVLMVREYVVKYQCHFGWRSCSPQCTGVELVLCLEGAKLLTAYGSEVSTGEISSYSIFGVFHSMG